MDEEKRVIVTKQEKIVSMFDEIAPTYDKANRVLSMGVDIVSVSYTHLTLPTIYSV